MLEEVTGKGQGHQITFSIQHLKHFQKSTKKHTRGKRTVMIILVAKDRQMITLRIRFSHINLPVLKLYNKNKVWIMHM